MKKAFSFFVLTALTAMAAAAFDWPQDEVTTESFHSYFGQLRGGTISSSLVFKDDSDIRTADEGTVIAIIKEHDDDFGWFESTLGNAVIISHNDQMNTVYANLDGDTMNESIEAKSTLSAGTVIGRSGNSGWQDGASCLEFKVFDSKNRTVINPRILMPRIAKEIQLTMGEITLEDRNGTSHKINYERYLPAGKYTIYKSRQNVAIPYRTVVSVNGAAVETITYDILTENEGRVCIAGNSPYPVETLYPDDERQLLAQVTLTRGRNTIAITITDVTGLAKTVTYNIDIY